MWNKGRRLFAIFLLCVLLSMPILLMAQPTGGGPGGGGPPSGEVPFEGLGFLIAAGIALGIKKIKSRK